MTVSDWPDAPMEAPVTGLLDRRRTLTLYRDTGCAGMEMYFDMIDDE